MCYHVILYFIISEGLVCFIISAEPLTATGSKWIDSVQSNANASSKPSESSIQIRFVAACLEHELRTCYENASEFGWCFDALMSELYGFISEFLSGLPEIRIVAVRNKI